MFFSATFETSVARLIDTHCQDADLLDWLRQQKGYQTRINAALRTFMEAQNP